MHHGGMIQDISHILLLRKKQTILMTSDMDTEIVIQRAKITPSKFTFQGTDDLLKKTIR